MTWIIMIIILGVSLIIAYRVHGAPPAKKEELAKTVSIVGGVGTALSLFLAAYTYTDSVLRQRELAAYGIYQEHMKISIDKPAFLGTSELARKEPPTKQSPIEEQNKYEPYQWYVGHALFSFESILEVSPDDYGWKDTFTGFICDHKKYLRSKEFNAKRYTEKLQELLKDTLDKKCEEQP